MGTANEIELKFPIASKDGLADKLTRLGFTSHGEVFESNIVLDTPDFALREQRRLLRQQGQDNTQQMVYVVAATTLLVIFVLAGGPALWTLMQSL